MYKKNINSKVQNLYFQERVGREVETKDRELKYITVVAETLLECLTNFHVNSDIMPALRTLKMLK